MNTLHFLTILKRHFMAGGNASLTSALDLPLAQCCLYHYEEHVGSMATSVNRNKTEYVKLSYIKRVSFSNSLRLRRCYL